MTSNRVLPTRIVLIGDPVAHSLSPLFQNAALRAAALPASYSAIKVNAAELGRVASALLNEGAAGNVTIPHKESIIAYCGRLTETASRVGAVNTFWCESQVLVGDNTDVTGADAAIRQLVGDDLRGLRCAVLGAGGSAAAVITALVDAGVSDIRVWARNRERASALDARIGAGARIAESVEDALMSCDLVVNATPSGMRDEMVPFDVRLLSRDSRLLDLVYRPGGTALVRSALARGIKAEDGLTMLVEQGAASFERWLGFSPDKRAMWDAIDAAGVR